MNKREADFFARLGNHRWFCTSSTSERAVPTALLRLQFLSYTAEKPRVKTLKGEAVLALIQKQKRHRRVHPYWWNPQ